jgi:integrase
MGSLEQSKCRDLFQDPNFRRWYENVARGSLATAQEWFRRMGLVRDRFGVTPRQIARMKQVRASDFFDVVGKFDREGRSGNYIANIVRPLKSWLSWNGVEINQRIKIPRSLTAKVENEKAPTPDELKRILNAADPRAKVACSLMALAGCRVEVLGSYAGEDGLEIRDLPELELKDGVVSFSRVPALVVVRKQVSKTRKLFLTFMLSQACEYVRQYLEDRARAGEELGPRSAIVTLSEYNTRTLTAGSGGSRSPTGSARAGRLRWCKGS